MYALRNAQVQFELETTWAEAGFRAYTPQEEDGCYIENAGGVLNEKEDWDEKTVCWWHMTDGAVLGVHDGMVIQCVDTYAPGPPHCTYGLRVPASCVLYVSAARGSWCATVRTPYACQPHSCRTYRGATGCLWG